MCLKAGGCARRAVGVEMELGMMGKRIGDACFWKGFFGNRCQEGVRSKGTHMMPR